ncbi:MAG: GNAT family protein [Pseudomonadota bacterium]
MIRRVTPSTEITATGPAGALILRHPRWSDYDAWANIRRRDAAYLKPWEPEWTEAHLSRGSYRLRLNRFRKMVQTDRAYPFHIFRADSDVLIGSCNLTHIERGAAMSAKIGYWVAQDQQGRGHARAAVRAVCRFGFDTLGLHRIEAAVQPDNIASVRVLEATDFRLEGSARGLLRIDGQWADHAVYARLSSD